MTNHVPELGRVVGQRCLDCKGAVKGTFGGRPGHVYAQDFIGTKSVGQGHPVRLESAEPDHYWLPGTNGAPDNPYDADKPVEEGRAAQAEASAVHNAQQAAQVFDTSTWTGLGSDPDRQDRVDTTTEVEP